MSTNRQLSREAEIINRKYELKYFPKVYKALKAKASSLIGIVKRDGINAAMAYVDVNNPMLSKAVENLYLEVGLRYARSNERRLRAETGKGYSPSIERKGFGFNDEWTKFIKDYLTKFLIEKITFAVNNTTRSALLAVLQEAVEKGWGIDETVKRLEELPFLRYQAARIVRTEVNRASNVGHLAQGSTYEFEMTKEWVAAKDKRTRGNPIDGFNDHADHWRLDGVKIDFYDKFRDPRNGDLLEAPGDPNASAASTINCRCRIVTRAKRDEDGNLIPKRSRISVIMPRRNIVRTITI